MKCLIHNISAFVSSTPPFSIEDISFALSEGQILAIVGESGSGKTSLLNALAGFLPVQHGAIILDDKTVSCASFCLSPLERNTAMIFQDQNLLPHLSLFENLVLGMEKREVKRQNIEISQLMKDLQLEKLKHSYPENVSGGQQQRIALGRALINDKKLLLFDEPFTGLDPHIIYTLARTIKESVKKYQRIAVLVTHHIDEAFLIADTIAVMKQGRVLQVNKPHIIYHEPDSLEIAKYMGPVNKIAAHASAPLTAKTDFGKVLVKYPVPQQNRQEFTILTRPDDYKICPGQVWKVEDVIYRGMNHIARIVKGAQEIQVFVEHNIPIKPGDRVNIELQNQHPYVAYDNKGNKIV